MAHKLTNALIKIGLFISFLSFFLTWFSCQTTSGEVTLNCIDVVQSLPPFSYPYGLLLILTAYFLKKANVREFFPLFFLLFFLLFWFLFVIFDYLTKVGTHITVDFPCEAELGFWCHVLGLTLILLGGCGRAIAPSTHP